MVFGIAKRVLVGRPMQSNRLGHTLLPKRIALPVFATVAVSVSAGVANLASAFPGLSPDVTLIAVLVVTAIALINLRGVRESGTAFAIPTYCFIGVVTLMIVWV